MKTKKQPEKKHPENKQPETKQPEKKQPEKKSLQKNINKSPQMKKQSETGKKMNKSLQLADEEGGKKEKELT